MLTGSWVLVKMEYLSRAQDFAPLALTAQTHVRRNGENGWNSASQEPPESWSRMLWGLPCEGRAQGGSTALASLGLQRWKVEQCHQWGSADSVSQRSVNSRFLPKRALRWLACVCQSVGGHLGPRISRVQMVIISPVTYFTFRSLSPFKFIFIFCVTSADFKNCSFSRTPLQEWT